MKEETKTAVALAHSRECTKELISGPTNVCSQGTVELEQENEISSEKNTATDVLPLALSSKPIFVFCGQCNSGETTINTQSDDVGMVLGCSLGFEGII